MKTTLALITVLMLAFVLQAEDAPKIITPEQAKDHIGEKVTVSGVVHAHVSTKGNGFLNFGGKYPHQIIAAYVPAGAPIPAPDLWEMEGKTVQVTGTVKAYRGKLEIIVQDRSQISP